MSKYEFIAQLEKLLQDLSYEERRDALRYYEDYFAEAGWENEEKILKELGSPERVATLIKEGLKGEDTGEFTEHGHVTETDKKAQEVSYPEMIENSRQDGEKDEYSYYEEYGGKEKDEYNSSYKKRDRANSFMDQLKYGLEDMFEWMKGLFQGAKGEKLILLIILVGVCAPTVIGILFGIIGFVFSILFTVITESIGLIFNGGRGIFTGIWKGVLTPGNGMIGMGIGIIKVGVGILLLCFFVWLVFGVLPAVIKGIKKGLEEEFGNSKKGE